MYLKIKIFLIKKMGYDIINPHLVSSKGHTIMKVSELKRQLLNLMY